MIRETETGHQQPPISGNMFRSKRVAARSQVALNRLGVSLWHDEVDLKR
jgi:hypothetical protein